MKRIFNLIVDLGVYVAQARPRLCRLIRERHPDFTDLQVLRYAIEQEQWMLCHYLERQFLVEVTNYHDGNSVERIVLMQALEDQYADLEHDIYYVFASVGVRMQHFADRVYVSYLGRNARIRGLR